MGTAELVLLIIQGLLSIYFSILTTRALVLLFFALRYKERLERYGKNEEILKRKPFVTIMIPCYNEKNVIERAIEACLNLDYENYEVLVVDDSTDDTVDILKRWAQHPKVRVVHRDHRDGWKGGALDEGLKHLDPRTEFILVVDADHVVPRDAIKKMLVRFVDEKIAAVQGYQFSVLNADENWITMAARTFSALGFAIEHPGRFALGGANPLCGSMMMIRRDVLEEVGGFGKSLTEDYDLTLRIYLHGYEVVYDEGIRSLAECPSSPKDFLRQICRWLEGRIRNFKRRLGDIMRSKELPLRKKVDLFLDYLANLAALAALIAFGCWLASLALGIEVPGFLEALGLPHVAQLAFIVYTSLGYPLVVFTALKREGERRTAGWLASFFLAMGLTVPFSVGALLRGAFSNTGYFYRTFKTGKITLMGRYMSEEYLSMGGARAPYLWEGSAGLGLLAMNFFFRPPNLS